MIESTGHEAGFWAPRDCFLEPPPALHRAADLLDQAANAILSNDHGRAGGLILEADDPDIWEFARQLMGPANQNILRFRKCETAPTYVDNSVKRMPSKKDEAAIFERDGWRCRTCSVRVLSPKAVKKLRTLFPREARWGRTNIDQHPALLVLKASIDHVIPHSRGGSNDPSNLLTACYPCQFGRSSWTLEEVGISDPRLRTPTVDQWDGLTRLIR